MNGAAFGAAGQRCMALTTAVWVGEAKEWIPELVERARKLKVNAGAFPWTRRFEIWWRHTGHEPDADLGPLISPQAKKRVLDLVDSGVSDGAELLLDGRDVNVKGYEKGNFVGPTIIHGVKVFFNAKDYRLDMQTSESY